MVPPVQAATVDNVENESSVLVRGIWFFRLLLQNDNTAQIGNNITTSARSGENVVDSLDDQSDTTLMTGGTFSGSAVENTANTNETVVDVESTPSTDDSVDTVTDESSVELTTEDSIDNQAQTANEVVVENNVDTTSDTGLNRVTSGDDLDRTTLWTGIANSATAVSNWFNREMFSFVRRLRP